MRIYICDDETPILKRQAETIQYIMPEARISLFSSGHALMEGLKRGTCDVLFLDIDMPGLSGLDIAGALNGERRGKDVRPLLLIFVTSHDELVYESLQYHPFGFIRKSFFEQEVAKILGDCRERLSTAGQRFSFRSEGRDTALFLSEILYFEADGNYLKVCTNTQTYRFRSTLTAVENSLLCDGFVRVHKGFLVNQSAVRLIGGEEVRLLDGTMIPFGKTYMKKAKRQLLEYMRS